MGRFLKQPEEKEVQGRWGGGEGRRVRRGDWGSKVRGSEGGGGGEGEGRGYEGVEWLRVSRVRGEEAKESTVGGGGEGGRVRGGGGERGGKYGGATEEGGGGREGEGRGYEGVEWRRGRH